MSENNVKLSVYGLLIDKESKVLMQKRSNTSFAEGWWSFPGGHVEAEESIIDAVLRELHEECNIIAKPNQCLFQLTLIRKPQLGKRYINFFYLITDWKGTPVISDGKASELRFFSPGDLPKPTLPYIEEALHLINNRIPFYESAY